MHNLFSFRLFFFTHPTVCALLDTTSHHRLIISIHKKTTGNHVTYSSDLSGTLTCPRTIQGGCCAKKINKLNVFIISIMTFYIKRKQYMISTTKALEERERRDQGDIRPKKKKKKCKGVLVGSLPHKKLLKILVCLDKPKSQIIPHQVSRRQSPC